MKQPDIFGGESGKEPFIYLTLKEKAGYRKATELEKIAGIICKHCENCNKREWGKTYYKCNLIGLSHCTSTDIALSGTCPKFKNN